MDYQYEGFRIIGHEGGHPDQEGGHPDQEGDFRIIDNGQAVIAVLSNVAPPFQSRQLMQYILDRGEFYNAEGQIAQFFPWLRPYGTTSQRLSDFRSGDANGDGVVTWAEYEKAAPFP